MIYRIYSLILVILFTYAPPVVSKEDDRPVTSTFFTPRTLTEQIMYSTVKIETEKGISSSFLFQFEPDDDPSKKIPCLVTNRHVFKDSIIKGKFIFHESDVSNYSPSGKVFSLDINLENFIVNHPNPSIDLCAIPLNPILSSLKHDKGISPFMIYLDKSILPSDEIIKNLSAVEDVLMVGYPIGLYDEANNFPIFRKGITSSHPAIDFNKNPEFMIDASCFPGSSGSPVFLYNSGAYGFGSNLVIGNRLLLLGILHSGAEMESENRIVSRDIPSLPVLTSQYNIMLNLGYVIKSNQLNGIKSELIRILKS